MSSEQDSPKNRRTMIKTKDGVKNGISEDQQKIKIVNRATAFGQLYNALLILLDVRKNFIKDVLKMRGTHLQRVLSKLHRSGANPFCCNMWKRQEPTPGNQIGHKFVNNH